MLFNPGLEDTFAEMIGVVTLHPSRRTRMDAVPFWPGLPSHPMDFAMDFLEDCIGGNIAMGPRHCPAHRRRCCPHEATTAWGSPRNFHPLLGDLSFLLTPRSGVPTCAKNDQNANAKSQTKEKESHEDCGFGVREDEHESLDAEVSKDLNKDEDKAWQYSVDVGGCDEVRAYTQDGLLVVEGRRRGSDSVSVRREISLPPHINPEKLKATLKKDGRLVLTTEDDTNLPSVTSVPVAEEDPKEASGSEGIAQEKENNQDEEANANESPQEKNEASRIDPL